MLIKISSHTDIATHIVNFYIYGREIRVNYLIIPSTIFFFVVCQDVDRNNIYGHNNFNQLTE